MLSFFSAIFWVHTRCRDLEKFFNRRNFSVERNFLSKLTTTHLWTSLSGLCPRRKFIGSGVFLLKEAAILQVNY